MDYRNSRYFCYYSSSSPFHKQFAVQEANSQNFQKFISPDLYESDNFRMYVYKVQKCSKLYSHDWTSCPFTHQGEKARRRDPRKYNYLPIPCPGYKFASCIKGDNCELCHGVFEYWLHPAKYRTNPCQAGTSCNRPVCFFAHTLNELRLETKYNWCYVYQYPLNIQSYPDIIIENGPNGNWMIVPCNPQLQPPPHDQYYSTTTFGHGYSPNPQQIPPKNMSTFELFAQPPPSSSQTHPRFGHNAQNESDFSLFSANHAKLIEQVKNLELGSTSHAKMNKIYDDKGKRSVEYELRDQKFSNIN
ncbi:zinc finger CCCH domain-containing protein 2-like [Solanum tuberosum]|uniref:C3HL domain class transcription factor n=1 Tax=Solanum tuberosum TaxID=4113 RepID=M1E0N9_SOLTU|nr:PREDICTED: zinc finger CCCH domain-containing protein 2-like [Solanum tuberosum]